MDKWKHRDDVVCAAASSEAGGAGYTSHGKHSEGCLEPLVVDVANASGQVHVLVRIEKKWCRRTRRCSKGLLRGRWSGLDGPSAEEVLFQAVTKKYCSPFQFRGSAFHS